VTVTQTVTVTSTAGAGAGVPATATAGGALPDPCALLSRAEVTTLVGTPMPAGVASGSAGVPTMCQFTGPTSGPTAQVEVFVGDGAKKMLDVDRGLGHTFVQVPGIGDETWQEDDNIFVRKAGTWVAINLVLLNSPAANAKPMRSAPRTAPCPPPVATPSPAGSASPPPAWSCPPGA
jgi:hypothetical protein